MSDYTLYHGDCLDILPTLEAGSVDAVIADIPSGRTACAWDSVIPFDAMWANLKRIAKRHAAIVLLGCTQPFTSALVMSNPKMFRYEWVWEKTRGANFASVRTQPLKKHESILLFSASSSTYNPQKVAGQKYHTRIGADRSIGIYGQAIPRPKTRTVHELRHPASVLHFPSMRQQDMVHPTQKPLALLEYLVKTYTNEGDTVLDFTFGSATTGVACLTTGRKFIGIEKDAEYFRIGSERMQAKQEELRYTLFSYDTTDTDKRDSQDHSLLVQSQILDMA